MRAQTKNRTGSLSKPAIKTLLVLSIDKKCSPFSNTFSDSFSTFSSETNQNSPLEISPVLDHGIGKFLDNFLCLHSADEPIGPGKLKKGSEDLSMLIQQTKKTLLQHDVILNIDLPYRYYGESSNLLKILNCEISFLPESFLRKLGLKQLSICHKDSTNNDCSLQVDVLDTESKVSRRLYKIIFDHMITTNPAILRDWEMLMKTKDFVEKESFTNLCSLEEVFIILFRNFPKYFLGELKIRAREFLSKYYPAELTEEWFEWRNKAKKKTRRVWFNLD